MTNSLPLSSMLRPSIHPRFSEPIFNDSEIQKTLAVSGYVVCPCLSTNEVESLLKSYEELLAMLPNGLPQTFCPSGRFSDPKLRNFARNAIEEVVPERLRSFFIPDRASLMGGTFLMKPPGPATALSPHQDSSHVDESVSFSIYAWIPLVDTTIENGAFHVLPGSHLWGNKHRSLNVPWCFSGLEKNLSELSEPVLVKRGEVCFFEGALIHSSPPNQTTETRVALNYFIKPQTQQFLHHYVDDKTPQGKVEVFGVDIDFFYSKDFESRPDTELFLRYEDAVVKATVLQQLAAKTNNVEK